MSDCRDSHADGVNEWRPQACVANVGVRFAVELHHHLVSVLGDAARSEADISRLVRTPLQQLSLTTLDAHRVVVACSPADLLQHRGPADNPEAAL